MDICKLPLHQACPVPLVKTGDAFYYPDAIYHSIQNMLKKIIFVSIIIQGSWDINKVYDYKWYKVLSFKPFYWYISGIILMAW